MALQSTLKVTAKGQVTLRREVLDHLGMVPGDKITVDFLPSGRAEVRAAKAPASIEDFIGSLRQPGRQPPSIEEINEVIAEGWAGRR
ncbi:MAG TPA: AbrB/MazE/SpoVT family DNA-binding domain-containing protein [Stellaceae bacterium]|nr:AbrB/MazE/SpoVT family DNA-binding domain-containing protein [Stellaceae bacterium]